MHYRKDIRSWRFYISVTRSKEAIGMNSDLANGDHVLMWDFDGVELPTVQAALKTQQDEWHLSNIYIVRSSAKDNYHAWCFDRASWGECLHIVADTDHVDPMFLKLAVVRGFFTLRISPKGVDPELCQVLAAPREPTASVDDLRSTVRYWTKRV